MKEQYSKVQKNKRDLYVPKQILETYFWRKKKKSKLQKRHPPSEVFVNNQKVRKTRNDILCIYSCKRVHEP